MRVGSVHTRELAADGLRLTGGFHLAEDQQAWRLLSRVTNTVRLKELCTGRGVFRGPIFTRTFCALPELGRPYVSPAELERADIHPSRYLAASHGSLLDELRLTKGMLLVTCSGVSLGRVIMARQSMDGVCASHDLIRMEVDERQVAPGYLYAFLRSRFGHTAMRRQIYGGNIKHIEPQHVESVPVPRIGASVEKKIATLIGKSTQLLEAYELSVKRASSQFFAATGLSKDIAPHEWHSDGPDLGFAVRGVSASSLRALNFNPRYMRLVDRIKGGSWRPLGDICVPSGLQRGGRFKRIDADQEHGSLLIGQKQLFWVRPEGRWIARRAADSDVFVPAGAVLVAARGTLGESELYCRAEFAWGTGLELAYSEDILRVVADEEKMLRGCLYAFMRSETAFRLLRSISVGTKLQDHHYTLRPRLPIPLPSDLVQRQIHDLVTSAYDDRHRAVALEREAVSLLERAVEEAA